MTIPHVSSLAAPLLGADNETVYGKLLGLTSGEVQTLCDEKAIDRWPTGMAPRPS